MDIFHFKRPFRVAKSFGLKLNGRFEHAILVRVTKTRYHPQAVLSLSLNIGSVQGCVWLEGKLRERKWELLARKRVSCKPFWHQRERQRYYQRVGPLLLQFERAVTNAILLRQICSYKINAASTNKCHKKIANQLSPTVFDSLGLRYLQLRCDAIKPLVVQGLGSIMWKILFRGKETDPTASFSTNHNKEIDLRIWHQDKRIRSGISHWLIHSWKHISTVGSQKSSKPTVDFWGWTRATSTPLKWKCKAMHKTLRFQFTLLPPSPPNLSPHWFRSAKMATVTTQASAAVFRPFASKSRFLIGSSGKLTREVSIKPVASSSSSSFKIEAKKGEWLPGLASPGYLDGRYVYK